MTTLSDKIARAAEVLRPKLIARRRDFHIHPELSNREERTARVVAENLRALGMDDIRTNVAHHGVVALLKGGKPGPVVAVRADMDALPIHETLEVPYKSQNPGVKHACGHDVHTTIELGVAEVLSKMREEISGTVKFIFQPAEEGAPAGEEGGAPLMIKEGALDNPRPLAIFGLHVTPELEVGKIGFRAGPAQAASDMFDIAIRGKMAHGAQPDLGIDAITISAQCISALQNIRSRRVDPFDPIVISIGTVHGGARRNVIADEVKLEGIIRTFSEITRRRACEWVRQILAGICEANGATFDLKITEGAALVYNEPRLVEESLPSLRQSVGAINVVAAEPRMGAEDFSYYQQVIPGFFFRLGTGNKTKGITADVHTPEFDVDEDCLVIGTKTMSTLVYDFLEHHAHKK